MYNGGAPWESQMISPPMTAREMAEGIWGGLQRNEMTWTDRQQYMLDVILCLDEEAMDLDFTKKVVQALKGRVGREEGL